MLCFIPNYKFLVLLHGGGAGVAPCRWHQEFPEPTSLMWMEQTGLGGSVHPGSPRELLGISKCCLPMAGEGLATL